MTKPKNIVRITCSQRVAELNSYFANKFASYANQNNSKVPVAFKLTDGKIEFTFSSTSTIKVAHVL